MADPDDTIEVTELPYLTADMPGVGGWIKETPEDFRVEELALYEPCGQGTHVYFRVVKRGIPTPVAVSRIAKYMGVHPGDIGFAGMKDARAVTSQMMSLEHVDAAKLAAYHDSQIEITDTWKHGNKLRPGHLAGNRFTIRIRGVGRAQLDQAQAILDVLIRRGVPNYFGQQRFGARGDTSILGEALVRGDLKLFISLYLGQPSDDDPPDCRAARKAFDEGDFAKALKCWPKHYSNERRALSAYKRKCHAGPAVGAIDKRIKRLYVSALQSAMFNDMLMRRIDTIDQVWTGDLAKKTDSGGVFPVEDTDAEQARAEAFEISPTAAVVGYRSRFAQGDMGRIEADVLAKWEIQPDNFKNIGRLSSKGTRRALRFGVGEPVMTAGHDKEGEYLELTFTAPPGSYATVALGEIMKDE